MIVMWKVRLLVAMLPTLAVGRLSAQEPVLESAIGVASGPEAEVFGHIADVAVGPSGDVFILDNQAVEVRWFDRRGVLRGRTGAAFRSPKAVELDGSGSLLVLDPLGGRIVRYRAGDDGLEHTGDISSPPAIDFCALDDRLILLRLRADSVITELDSQGRIVAAWGTLIEPEPGHDLAPEEIRRELDNRAHLACDDRTQTITILYERIPLVRRFTADGDRIWDVELADYHRIRDVHTPDESGWMAAPDPESGTAHSGRSIVVRHDGALVVTLYEGSTEGGAFEVRVLAGANGAELARGPVPMIVAGAERETATGYLNSPVPRVLHYSGVAVVSR